MTINLSDTVIPEEDLARIICDSSKPKNYEKTSFRYSKEEGRYIICTGKFIDSRNPTTLSVNRISTLSEQEAHKLGIIHQKEKQSQLTYHGFAKITAKLCFDKGCGVKKDDDDGKKPYHANIIYPYSQDAKEEKQEVAVYLAFHAELRKFDDGV